MNRNNLTEHTTDNYNYFLEIVLLYLYFLYFKILIFILTHQQQQCSIYFN